MIDTHIHLDFEAYDSDREEVISRFFSSGGKAIVNIGVDEKRMKDSIEIARSHEKIFAAVGFHPQEGTDLYKQSGTLDFVEKFHNFAEEKKVVAVGEIGLDYFHPSAADYELKINEEIKNIQKEIFLRQLKISQELRLPVIIHCWDAHEDCWEVIKNFLDLRIVFHCYGKGVDVEYTKKLLKHENIFFSFTGNVTFPKPGKNGSEIFEHIKLIPLERMMVETDGPFLAPAPYRGKRNEPAYVKYVIEKIAEIKGMSVSETETLTDRNAIQFFNLPIIQ